MVAWSPSSTATEQKLRDLKSASLRESVRQLTSVLAAVFTIETVIKLWLGRAEGMGLILLAAGSAVVLIAVRAVLWQWRLPDQWIYPLLLLVELIALVGTSAQLYVLGRPHDSTNFGLLIIAVGMISFSAAWSSLLIALVWGSWLVLALVVHPSSLTLHYGMFLLWITALATVVQAVRARWVRRLIASDAESRARLEELVAERTRQLEVSLEQLRQSERLASIGTLAAGIAHEINNPVGMMLLSAEELLYRTPKSPDGETERRLREIVDNAKRSGQIVKAVLRFAQHEPAEREPDDVNQVIHNVVSFARPYAAQRGGAIHTTLAADLPAVMLNRTELEQALINLVRNGIEAADSSPQITVTSQRVDKMVRLSVSDNGRGIKPEDSRRMFDPFYTTRRHEGGTGLGLSMAYAIVTDHGGTIRVEHPRDGGTAMVVDLPATSTA